MLNALKEEYSGISLDNKLARLYRKDDEYGTIELDSGNEDDVQEVVQRVFEEILKLK